MSQLQRGGTRLGRRTGLREVYEVKDKKAGHLVEEISQPAHAGG